tara:strand:+ start:1050 stop:2327 length:1278 start_codon:yes stop_codon:yes gene_type:complete
MINQAENNIAVLGMGYVGLPLAVEFGKFFDTIGFDINKTRIDELNLLNDTTLEVSETEIRDSDKLSFTLNLSDLRDCNIYIITVPTPIDSNKNPDLSPLLAATESVGEVLKKEDIVIYESTVFPGATEEVCVPILEKKSKLQFNKDFFCGYSPERINPGDKDRRLPLIKKVTSGSNNEVAERIDSLYKKIITAGTYKAESIKIAEAAKVIENTQRDVNIALINELSMIFNKLDIDTESVLRAAETKWNFLSFRPGLVGGHCIGVDPYYLTYKAIKSGFNPEVILAGRRINDLMGSYVANNVIELLIRKKIQIENSNILVLGFSFKENCPDLRNTKVIDVVNTLKTSLCNVDIFDPWVNHEEAQKEYNLTLVKEPKIGSYDAVIIAVGHDEFKKIPYKELKKYLKTNHVIYDVKYLLDNDQVDGRL